MSAQSLAVESSSESSSSKDDGQGRAQLTTRPKRKKDIRSSAWTFRSDIETDLLSAEGVPVDEKTKLLSEHIRTRISHTQPPALLHRARPAKSPKQIQSSESFKKNTLEQLRPVLMSILKSCICCKDFRN